MLAETRRKGAISEREVIMRVGLVRNVGLGVVALALLAVGACSDNPVSFDVKTTEGIFSNPSLMVITAEQEALLQSRTINQGGDPTYETITASVDGSCFVLPPENGAVELDIVPNPDAPTDPNVTPPGEFLVTGMTTLGKTCIALSGGGATAEVEVINVADSLEFTSAPIVVRAGDSDTVVARLIGAEGTEVLPYDSAVVIWTSLDTLGIVVIDPDSLGGFTTSLIGPSGVQGVWPGQEENGTVVPGVTLTTQAGMEVIPNVPDTAFYAVGEPMGAFLPGSVTEFEVFVADGEGNRNSFPSEILGVTMDVDEDPLVATATARIATDEIVIGNVHVVEVTGVGPGTVTISGTVQTAAGDIAFAGTYIIPDPVITSITPDNGAWAEFVTITGTDFDFPGVPVKVFVDGLLLGNYTVVSPTEITAQMPTYGAAGGPFEVTVDVGGLLSAPAGWTQNVAFVENDFEPNSVTNGDPATPASLPLIIENGSLIGEAPDGFFGGQTDWLRVTVSQTRNVSVVFDWTSGPDKDFFIIDAGFNFFICQIASVAKPETGDCELPGPDQGAPFESGEHDLIPQGYDEVDSEYSLSVIVIDD
jgi:hypothetical protein